MSGCTPVFALSLRGTLAVVCGSLLAPWPWPPTLAMKAMGTMLPS